MLDTDCDVVHFFKNTTDSKPYQSYSLNHGVLTDLHQDTDIVDEATGQRMPGFKF